MAKANKNRKQTMAAQADRHVLYEASVQDPESEMEFVSETFDIPTQVGVVRRAVVVVVPVAFGCPVLRDLRQGVVPAHHCQW